MWGVDHVRKNTWLTTVDWNWCEERREKKDLIATSYLCCRRMRTFVCAWNRCCSCSCFIDTNFTCGSSRRTWVLIVITRIEGSHASYYPRNTPVITFVEQEIVSILRRILPFPPLAHTCIRTYNEKVHPTIQTWCGSETFDTTMHTVYV